LQQLQHVVRELAADRFNRIGNPKSASSRRTIPIGPLVANTKVRPSGAARRFE